MVARMFDWHDESKEYGEMGEAKEKQTGVSKFLVSIYSRIYHYAYIEMYANFD